MYTSWPLDCPLPTAGRRVPLLYCQKRADSRFVPINLTFALALHQMAFALLTPIAIEPVLAELAPSLVILGLVRWAKQVAEGVYKCRNTQKVSNTLSFG